MKRILIAPLNWGLGHASRCMPLIVRHLRAGDEVVLAGDGESLMMLTKRFPGLRAYPLAPLQLRYSSGNSQIAAVISMLPKLLIWAKADQQALQLILQRESFDLIISDNRPGLYSDRCTTAYITHQIRILMPCGLRWLESLGQRLHARLIHRFSECWIPDFETENNFSGALSHTPPLPDNARFIDPLSRFEYEAAEEAQEHYDAVAILSGLEPQRSLLEKQLIAEYKLKQESLLLIRGKIGGPQTTLHIANRSALGITILPTLSSGLLRTHLMRAHTIISRSGYSSIMDYAELGLIEKAEKGEITLHLIPTPGQPEQEYLAKKWNKTGRNESRPSQSQTINILRNNVR